MIEDCLFEINLGTFGGAVFLREVTSILTNCMFRMNFAGEGGALNFEIASPVLIGCTPYANVARSNGSTLYCLGDCEPRCEQCTVCFDVCLFEGSAFMLNITGTAHFTRCIVYGCTGGPAFSFGQAHRPVLTCCDINANEGGDWTQGIADQLGARGVRRGGAAARGPHRQANARLLCNLFALLLSCLAWYVHDFYTYCVDCLWYDTPIQRHEGIRPQEMRLP